MTLADFNKSGIYPYIAVARSEKKQSLRSSFFSLASLGNKKKSRIPDAPGVYFFLGPKKEILYIGKATSLRDRIRSYFSPDLPQARGVLVVQMVEKARAVEWRQTDSVLEALILEASLIKTHKPKHNTQEKDDKSFNHVVITDETFPRVLVVRGKELAHGRNMVAGGGRGPLRTTDYALRSVFGPFPHGAQLKEAMKIVRKIFPYRDRCQPCKEPSKRCKPCFNRQLGLCPGVCSGEVSAREYARTIRAVTLFFEGKKKRLLQELERGMHAAAREERFEDAIRIRKQIFALQHIQDVSLIKDEYRSPNTAAPFRIEAYDIAHLRGEAAIGVMTVVEDGAANTREYRTFALRDTKPGDDPGALREVLSRRLAHAEWTLPRLIVVDGGKAQRGSAESILSKAGVVIPVVSVIKDEKHRARAIEGDRAAARAHEKGILLANAESHRFAIGRHRRARRLVRPK